MSKVGKKPIELTGGAKLSLSGKNVTVEGSKGKLNYVLPEGITVKTEGNIAEVITERDDFLLSKFHGLARAMINNMVVGVTTGYKKSLDIVGVGYKAQMKGNTLVLNVGFSHPVDMQVWEGLKVATPTQTSITVEGIDKQKVGEFSAQVRRIRPPEPYLGKGIKYTDEVIRRKAGKSAKK